MAELHLLSKQSWVTLAKVCPGWALNIIQPAEVGFESDMGTDAVFKGQSAASDTIYHHMLLDKIKYLREKSMHIMTDTISIWKRTNFPIISNYFYA